MVIGFQIKIYWLNFTKHEQKMVLDWPVIKCTSLLEYETSQCHLLTNGYFWTFNWNAFEHSIQFVTSPWNVFLYSKKRSFLSLSLKHIHYVLSYFYLIYFSAISIWWKVGLQVHTHHDPRFPTYRVWSSNCHRNWGMIPSLAATCPLWLTPKNAYALVHLLNAYHTLWMSTCSHTIFLPKGDFCNLTNNQCKNKALECWTIKCSIFESSLDSSTFYLAQI